MFCLLFLQVLKENGDTKYLDILDETKCNWMIFVRPARNYSEQNMAAFLKDDNVYFVSIKVVLCSKTCFFV